MAVSEWELTGLASDEMDLARRMSWKELIRVTPWTDTYVAVSSAGFQLEVERRYIWANDAKSEIRVEVWVRTIQEPLIEAVEKASVTSKGFA